MGLEVAFEIFDIASDALVVVAAMNDDVAASLRVWSPLHPSHTPSPAHRMAHRPPASQLHIMCMRMHVRVRMYVG